MVVAKKEFLGGNHFMKKSLFQKALCLILSVTLLLGALVVTVSAGELKPGSTASTLEEMQAITGANSYADYILNYATAKPGPEKITLDNASAVANGNAVWVTDSTKCKDSQNANQSNWVNFGEENKSISIYVPATGSVTWTFTVPDNAAGLYYIKIDYYNCQTDESSISEIERKLYIDEKLPFSEAGNLAISKNWEYDYGQYKQESVVVNTTTKPNSYNVEYKQVNGKDQSKNGYYKIVTDIVDGVETITTYKISQDINGNSMAPKPIEVSSWNTYYCQDAAGYHSGYFQFYILNGTRTLTLQAEREPMIIRSVELVPVDNTEADVPTYQEMLQYYQDQGYKAPTNGTITTIEAEFPDLVSDSSVYATNDNTSAKNYPISPKAQLYNVIGENSYNTVGQWAAYKFKVNESGLYKFGMRYKQSALQGMYICRSIKLAGGQYGATPQAPFQEAYNAKFDYNKEWQSTYVGDGSGNAFQFYFEAGVEYTVYIECSLGSLRELIQRVEVSLNTINDCYLRILQLTGSDPKEVDYGFLSAMPDVLVELLKQAQELENIKTEFEKLSGGETGSHTATLHTIAILLDTMGSDDGWNIPANLTTLKSYLGTLGTWINSSKNSSMMVDSISVCPITADDKAIPRAKANFFQSFGYEISSFFFSFFTNYDQMGLTSLPDANTETIDVWLAMGRDQSQIWRTMIDEDGGFTQSTGVAVTLKLVTGGTLLPSILSGKGPDVYIGLGSSDVINYAIRDAVMGVSGNTGNSETDKFFSSNYYTYKVGNKFEDTTEYKGDENLTYTSYNFKDAVGDNFAEAAMDTITLLDVTYALPNTRSFAMMFYRMDVLAELGHEVPESWSQLLALLPVLQTNNMSVGVNYISAIDFMIYQMGGNMWKYPDNPEYAGIEVDLDSHIALEAFEYVCRLYTDYSFPVSYDAANRFRTGEMPIIIGDYAGIYNQLVVYATEIAGLWEFTSLPGTMNKVTGEFDYHSLAGVGATVMLHGCDSPLAAWQFMQWQTSASVQASYGNKMVALIGPSAKYESANLHTLWDLSWTASEKDAIFEQITNLYSIVNYPGSYIIGRYTKFAFLAAVNDGKNPIDAMNSYIDAINAEIKRKRAEFNLTTELPE